MSSYRLFIYSSYHITHNSRSRIRARLNTCVLRQSEFKTRRSRKEHSNVEGEQCISDGPARHRHLVLERSNPCTDEPLLHVHALYDRCRSSGPRHRRTFVRRTLRDVELATTVTSLRATAGCCSTRESDFRYDRAATPPENGHARRRECITFVAFASDDLRSCDCAAGEICVFLFFPLSSDRSRIEPN